MTIDEVRAELAHLREVPARLRLERLMRESGGLVDILEGMLWDVPRSTDVDLADETQPGARGGFVPVGSPGATGQTTWSEAMSKPIKRKRGRPARRVESGGEA